MKKCQQVDNSLDIGKKKYHGLPVISPSEFGPLLL